MPIVKEIEGEFLVSPELLKYWYPSKQWFHRLEYPDEYDDPWVNYVPFRPTHMIELVFEGRLLASDLVALNGKYAYPPLSKTDLRIPLYCYEDGQWWNYVNEKPEWRNAELFVQRATWVENNSSIGWVYFIREGSSGPVKIGWSKDPYKRMAALQTANPNQLILLGTIPGHLTEEKRLHQRFARDRMNGEWFRFSDEIRNFVSNCVMKG